MAYAKDRSWRMTIYHHKLKQVITPISAAVPDVFSLLEQIKTSSGTQHAATDLANAFLQQLLVKTTRSKTFPPSIPAFTRVTVLYTSMYKASPAIYLHVLPQRSINSPVLGHNLVCMDLGHLSCPQDITLIHYINNIMLIGPGEQEVATTLDFYE